QPADRRGLAGTVGPQDAEDLAGVDRERHVVHRGHLAETLDQVAHLDDVAPILVAHRALVAPGAPRPAAPAPPRPAAAAVAGMIRASAGSPALSAPPGSSSSSFPPNARFACSSSVSAARGVTSASLAMLTTRPANGRLTPTGRPSTGAPSRTFVSSGAATNTRIHSESGFPSVTTGEVGGTS